MKRADIEKQLAAAHQEMEERLQEKMLLDLRLGQLSQTIQALDLLLQTKPIEPVELLETDQVFGETGITNAIRALLVRTKTPLSPVQIRAELMNRNFDLSDYVNAMAVIHNTLKRLDKQGELTTVKNPAGQIIAYTAHLQDAMKAERIAKAKEELRKNRTVASEFIDSPVRANPMGTYIKGTKASKA
jgi:YD repeat-containing protein